MNGHTPGMNTTQSTRGCRTNCRRETLVDEGPTWSVWQCTTCDRRRSRAEAPALFGRRELEIPNQPEESPDAIET